MLTKLALKALDWFGSTDEGARLLVVSAFLLLAVVGLVVFSL